MGQARPAGVAGRALQLRLASGIVAYDQYGAEAVRRALPGKPVFVAPNSTDGQAILERRKVLSRDGVAAHRQRLGLEFPAYLFSLGRLIPEKRFDRVIQIVAGLRKRGVSVGAIIIGDGPGREALLRQIRDEGLVPGTDVILVGRVDEPERLADWMYAADLAVLPGYVGLAAIDSMFGGLPMVSSVPDKNGPFHAPEWFVVRPSGLGLEIRRNDVAEYVRAIEEYLSRPERSRAEHSESCVAHAREHFGIRRLVEGLELAIRSVHGTRGSTNGND
jgi:glycosyltransferase involved in cell wall biosynthesis